MKKDSATYSFKSNGFIFRQISGEYREKLRSLSESESASQFLDVIPDNDVFSLNNICYSVSPTKTPERIMCYFGYDESLKRGQADVWLKINEDRSTPYVLKLILPALKNEIFNAGALRIVIDISFENEENNKAFQSSGFTISEDTFGGLKFAYTEKSISCYSIVFILIFGLLFLAGSVLFKKSDPFIGVSLGILSGGIIGIIMDVLDYFERKRIIGDTSTEELIKTDGQSDASNPEKCINIDISDENDN